MDNRDTGSLKNNKKMDANTIWQWRMMHVKKYSRHPESFHYSNNMRLDFNVRSNTHKKLDLRSLTNGVILEVCDFAKTVRKSKWHFITNILENNFDLGLKNEQQRIEFTSQILHKVRDLIQKPPEDKHEAFTLFDTSSEPECSSNSKSGPNMGSTEYKTDWFLVDMDGMDESEHEDKLKCSQAPSKDYMKMEEMDGPRTDDSGDDDDDEELECSKPKSARKLEEDVLPPSFPCCEVIGLNLDVWSKQSLDPGLLTKGMMLELVQFTRALTASHRSIVLSVLKHNFELDLKSQQETNQVWFTILQLQKRKKLILTTGTKISPDFKSEPFFFQTNPLEKGSALSRVGASLYRLKEVSKRRQSDLKSKCEKRALSTTREHVTKRRRTEQAEQEETNTLSHHTDMYNSETAEEDHSYMCTLDSDKVTDSENNENGDDLQNPTSSDIHSKSESSCMGTREPFLTSTNGSSSLPIVNSIVNLMKCQPDERGQCGDEEKTAIPRTVPYKCDMEEEEMETESHMWKLRANRVKQILSLQEKEYCAFFWSKKAGIEFDVGFGPKQNFSIDSLCNPVLLEVAKFALAMNSSQQDFIMEILEYNLDFSLWSEHHRKTVVCEVMNRVRQLKRSDDSVRLSKEVFGLPGPMSSVNMTNQSMGSVKPEVGSILRTTESNAAPMCPPDLQAENKEHRVDIYPFCKDIGLKLNVISSQPHKKLEINKLTNGAMTEVTNFVEKLCGTFDQICIDILRHNFDLDWQNGDSDLAKTILARIPVILEHKNLSNVTGFKKINPRKHKEFLMMVMDCQNSPNLDTCSTGSSQAPTIDQNVGSSVDTDKYNELDLLLWKLRANQIQQILSVPHVEHCPFYSYSRCKKLGIDFNVGSGVKQNLDLKLLTNGIMVEMNTFSTALQPAQKDFITEILEYNFHLNFNNEMCRNVFAQQVLDKLIKSTLKCTKSRLLKMSFKLPDLTDIDESTYLKAKYCPKCYQDRNSKISQDESNSDHMLHPRPHAMTDTVSTEANCTAQKPTKDLFSTFQVAEETIMDSYPLCKKIRLSLCVDKNKPKDKLDPHVLTNGIMKEVASFSKRLCGTKHKLINDILEHNFNLGMQSQYINLTMLCQRMLSQYGERPTWFNEVFVIQPCTPREFRDVRKVEEVSATQENERKETTKKRKQTLQTKKKEATLLSDSMGAVKSRRDGQNSGDCYLICTEIGLDLDMTSKSGDKEKLDLKLLTRAAVMEIYKFLGRKPQHYFPGALFDILDYNFNLSSQHYRQWEFSIATAAKVKTMVKQYRKKLHRANEVFKLPFVFERKELKGLVQERQNESPKSSVETADMTTNEECRAVQPLRNLSDVNHAHLLNVKTNEELWFEEEDTKSQTDPGTIMQMTGSPVSGDCDSRFQENIQIKKEEDDSHYGDMKPEPVTEEIDKPAGSFGYTLTICPKSESHIKTESETEDAQYYNLAEPQVSEGYARHYVGTKTESSVKTESDSEDVKYEIPVEAAGSSYSMVTICQDTESKLIKQEQENRSVFIMEMFQTQSEVEIKQEQDS